MHMDKELFTHLMGVVAQTGDRLVVVDPASRRPFVIMGLPQYEALHGLSAASSEASFGQARMSQDDTSTARANAELAAWREREGIPAPAVGLSALSGEEAMSQGPAVGFAAEPMEPAPLDDDRFYVEPLE
jgi:hypothetical protein